MMSTDKNIAPQARSTISARVLLFAILLALLVGYPVYLFLRETISGGIRRQGEFMALNLKAMSDFEMDQVTATDDDIPRRWREQNGRKVILDGEMYLRYGAGPQIKEFDLCWSIAKCCFSGPQKIQHFVKASVPSGSVPNYYGSPVRVIGTLSVGVQRGKAGIESIYRLDVEKVERL